jgi:copper chaperone CopZ
METMSLAIAGMSCQHCVRAVREALEGLPGVVVDRVEIGSAAVSFEPADVSGAAVLEAISDAGYEPSVQAA